ncbi:hypothetical protein GQX74_008931 [Glossina fuscipes]|nr:hypothetical protein GQX74_008931 [Glossina fuscipes]
MAFIFASIKKKRKKDIFTWFYIISGLSKRPMGPPHRKSSLPKHQEVKKRFLEICDTTLSEEVRNALRLPAFDSYEWSDADIIHLMQTMFTELGFIEKFNIPIDILREWLYEVYKHYNEVPFHNFRHCFCVAQMMYAITRQANLLQRLGDLECLILLLCMILIKVADISNEARPMDVAEPWLDRLLQEFFAQSAAEKSEGLPVTPFMDPDKISKPGSQVRFIGLVLLPLFEALGDLVPEVTELIIIPVRIAFDYYKRLNDAQTKSRKSMADTSSAGPSGDNSGASDNKDNSNSSATVGGGMANGADTTASAPSVGNSGGSISPQMPRSQSGISVKSRRSIPSQKSASRTSVDEPGGIPAELHDLPEGSESGDSETATEVDVAEKTSKFKVDTEGSSNRSKSSHSTSRKSSREKRPSMIGEMCSSGQRIRNSYGNIHGYHANRGHFSSNRAVSLDQYSTNNRRSSDGLQQVISDSNVFYNRHNRSSLEASTVICRLAEDMNMNQQISTANGNTNHTLSDTSQLVPNLEGSISDSTTGSNVTTAVNNVAQPASLTLQTTITATANQHNIINMSTMSSNGNMSPTQILQPRQHICTTATSVAANNTLNGVTGPHSTEITAPPKSSWKARLKQFSEYFSFSFDKSSKRFGSTRSSPCSMRNNNTAHAATITGPRSGTYVDPLTGKPTGICCTISNNLQSPSLRQTQLVQHQQDLIAAAAAGRHRAYSLDVPCNRSNPRYSSSSGGGGDSSRKSSRHDGGGLGDVNNSNNTLHSSSGTGSEMPTCMPPPIRIGSVDASDTILITTGGLSSVLTPTNLGDAAEPSLSIDLGSSATEPPKI